MGTYENAGEFREEKRSMMKTILCLVILWEYFGRRREARLSFCIIHNMDKYDTPLSSEW